MSKPTTQDWFAVRDELAHTLTITRETPRRLSGTTRDGHLVRIECARNATDWLVVSAWVCGRLEMDPALVLERNGELLFSTLVLAGNDYWLRVAVPLDSVEVVEPARLVALAVEAAGALSPVRFVVVAGPRETFSHYAE